MSSKLFVGNIASEATSAEVRELFATIGNVTSCQLITDRDTGSPKGFGFVEMESADLANTAKTKLNGHDLHGKPLKVDVARPRER